jgi:hypothetical protein
MNPRSTGRICAALCFVLLAFAAGLADRGAAQIQYRTVALHLQAAPAPPAGDFYAFLDTPVLNDIGQVAYRADLYPSLTADDEAIYAGPLTAPQVVAHEGDAAPGTPLGVNYLSFDPPALNNVGQVAFGALLTGNLGAGVTTANDGAIYAGPLGAPQLVAREGDAAPGTPGIYSILTAACAAARRTSSNRQ